jgi:hypothetical protein
MNVIIQSRLEYFKTNPLVCDAENENESLSTIQSGMEWRTVLSTSTST